MASSIEQREAEIHFKEKVDLEFFKKDWKIVAIGDSLTKGIGDKKGNGYLRFLKEDLSNEPIVDDLVIENLGIGGIRSDQLLSKIKQKEITETIDDADIVLITIGGNDLLHVVQNNFFRLSYQLFEQEQKEFKENLEQTINYINLVNKNSEVYVIGLYNPFQWFGVLEEIDTIIQDWNAASQEVVKQYDRTNYIPIDDLFAVTGKQLLYEEDQFHPNEEGYRLIAERVFTHLQDNLKGPHKYSPKIAQVN